MSVVPILRRAALLVGLCLTPAMVFGQAASAVWRAVAPGGRTRCAFDTPFEFWVRPGDAARVFIYLQGGGACWNLESCAPGKDTAFDAAIDSTDHRQRRDGIFDRDDATNPFRDHTAIFVPYCTGDLHLGTRTVRYGAVPGDSGRGVTVHHAGFHNVTAVLDYLATQRTTPRLVTIVGASAGGVASPIVAAEVARRLPETEVRQIADGAGAFRVPRLRALLAQWAVDSLLASLGSPLADSGDLVVGMYRSAAVRQPRVRFSQVGTTSDAVVGGWLSRFGDDPGRVATYISTTYRELTAAGVCFAGYTLSGADHTVLWRRGALATPVSGQPLGARIRREVLDAPCKVERPQAPPARDAAFLFAYRAKPEMDAAFAQGYRRHLDWHAAHNDSLTWLAWTIIDGPGIGTFVDGAFGVALEAFDDRVDPRGDGEDAGRNVTAFATPPSRQLLRLRHDLGLTTRLEQGRPGAMQRVVSLTIKPGSEPTVEQTLRTLATRPSALDYAVYEQMSGGEQPAFVIVAQFDAWADLDDAARDPVRTIVRALGSTVSRVESAVWQHRPDLTYTPRR